MARTSTPDVFKKYQQKKYNKSRSLFGEDMPDDDFDHFEETPHGPGKGKKKGQSGAGRKYQHEGGISEEYFSEQYTGASGDGMSFDIKQ